MLRLWSLLLFTATMSVSATKAAPQNSVVPEPNLAEQYLESAADRERTTLGLPTLRRDPALVAAARAHALEMVSHGTISHQFPNEPDLSARGAAAGARFSLISENVAESPSAIKIHDAWMHSEGHRHNLLDPNVDAVGIVVIARGHQLFAVEDFERSIVTMTLLQQESLVAASITAAGVLVEQTEPDTRDICRDDSGRGKGRQADFVMRYTTADLRSLPEKLKGLLITGKYSTAAVGACHAEDGGNFSLYRIAVLLYR